MEIQADAVIQRLTLRAARDARDLAIAEATVDAITHDAAVAHAEADAWAKRLLEALAEANGRLPADKRVPIPDRPSYQPIAPPDLAPDALADTPPG